MCHARHVQQLCLSSGEARAIVKEAYICGFPMVASYQMYNPDRAGKGFFVYFRACDPTKAYFDKSRSLPNVELVK